MLLVLFACFIVLSLNSVKVSSLFYRHHGEKAHVEQNCCDSICLCALVSVLMFDSGPNLLYFTKSNPSCCSLINYLLFRRFGFANPEALAAGETGTACRGEEHDITLVWSITSGKRLVLADGQEVHYSSSRNSIFDFSWTMRGNHVLKIVAHASPPLSPTPGFRQYDFSIDGQSFFTFPKVYRLGMAPNDPRGQTSPTSPVSLSERSTSQQPYSNYQVSAPPQRSAPQRASSDNIASYESPTNPDEVSQNYPRDDYRDASLYLKPKLTQYLFSLVHPTGGSILEGGNSAVVVRRKGDDKYCDRWWRWR